MVSVESLLPWLPRILVDALTRDPSRAERPWEQHLTASVLVLDMSGFTRLTERYAQRGLLGVEALTRRLNASLSPVIDRILRTEGDIIKFAGDALVVLFPAEPQDLPAPGPDRSSLLRALDAGLGLQADFHQQEMDEGLPLSLRVSVHVGPVLLQQVGGERGRWELLCAGEALFRAARANASARPGEVVLDATGLPPAILDHLQERFLVEPRGQELVQIQFKPGQGVVPQAIRPPKRSPEPPPAQLLLRFIPGAVRARLEAGQGAWLGELRRVSILFVQLRGLGQTPLLTRSHDTLQALQQLLYRYEGSLNKLSSDDKGTALVAAFGLPPLAHEDDPVRALQAALAMRDTLCGLGLEVQIGLTTGTAFCGAFGSPLRLEYTMLGDVVNLAARLMQGAEGGILCDFATWLAGRDRVELETLPPRLIKGKANPVPVFRPLKLISGLASPGLVSPQSAQPTPSAHPSDALVGRVEEQVRLSALLRSALEGHGQLALLEGEAGIGKSSLLSWVREEATRLGLGCVQTAADAVESSTPYFAWRRLLLSLLPPADRASPILLLETLRERLERLRTTDAWKRSRAQGLLLPTEQLLGLLGTFLPFGVEGHIDPEGLTQVARAEAIRELLLRLLEQGTEALTGVPEGPYLILVEDAHWLDSSSWHCFLHLTRQLRSLSLVITSRPLIPPLPVDAAQLLLAPGVVTLKLERLGPEELIALVERKLRVRGLPLPVQTLLKTRSEGHPFFAEELAQTLLEQGLIGIEGHVCTWLGREDERLSERLPNRLAMAIPETLQGVITSRMDRLSPSEQLTLKVASVIGRSFSFHLLSRIHPVEHSEHQLLCDLASLQSHDLTWLEAPEPELSYTFKHVIVHEVAYNLMLFAQRRELHARAARYLSALQRIEGGLRLPILAFHFLKAELWAEAFRFCRDAGEEAMHQAAYQEAERFFRDALVCSEKLPHLPLENRIALEKRLGESLFGLGQIEDARDWLELALARCWGPLPRDARGWFWQLLWRGCRALWSWLDPGPEHPLDSLVLAVLQPLEVVYFYRVEGVASLVLSVERLRLARLLNDRLALVQVWATLTVVAYGFGLPGRARALAARVQAEAPILHGPGGARIWLVLAQAALIAGELPQVRACLQQAQMQCRDNGDHRLTLEYRGLEGWLMMLQGQLGESLHHAQDTIVLARSHGDVQGQIWGGVGLAQIYLLLGAPDKAEAQLREVEQLPPVPLSVSDELWLFASWAQLLMVQQRLDEAVRCVLLVSRRVLALPDLVLNLQVLRALGQLLRVLLLWQLVEGPGARPHHGLPETLPVQTRGALVHRSGEGKSPEDPGPALQRVQARLQRILKVSSRTVRPFQPEAKSLNALDALGQGRIRTAAVLWEESFQRAVDLQLPLEELVALQDAVHVFSVREAEYDRWRARLSVLEERHFPPAEVRGVSTPR